MKAYELGRGPLSRLIEAVQYDLAPQLHKRGAHVWIEAIDGRGARLGFACWAETQRPELLAWCRARLAEHLDDRALGMVALHDAARPQQRAA